MKTGLPRATTLFSVLCGVVLIIALMKFARVDAKEVMARLADLNPAGLTALFGLWFVYTLVSAEKWLLIERNYDSKNLPSHATAFGLTALGWLAGQVAPLQVATAFMRGLGSKVLVGRNAWHGAAATLYEQAFDLTVVALLGGVSFLCLALSAPWLWIALAIAALSIFTISLKYFFGPLREFFLWLGKTRLFWRAQQVLAGSGKMLDLSLARKLTLFSILRFFLLCTAAAATTWAAGLEVPALHLAIAMPLVALASLVPLTPAALGINELVFATVLSTLGTPFETGLQWALLNRLLVILASLAIGACGLLLLWRAEKTVKSR